MQQIKALRQILLALSFSLSFTTSHPTATIDSGVLVGITTSLPESDVLVKQFLGIPFAQSPPKRFTPPVRPRSWDANPLEVKTRKPACIQQFNYPRDDYDFVRGIFNEPAPEESEDCLYLNVFAPDTQPPEDGRAVLFWIFGGSLRFGNAGQPIYDGSSFAANQDVIVVTVNYRTNVFGFPNSPELPVSGQNLGFLDQRAALEWVQRNIESFGGNPSKVTLVGESAGGFSIDALLTSYPKGSTPPFRGAILQSGQLSYSPIPFTNSISQWNDLATALNCTGSKLECVRNAPATAIKSIIEQGAIDFNPVVDNITLIRNPANARKVGNIARIPTLSGTVSQEGRVFQNKVTNLTEFIQQYFYNYPHLWSTLEEAYPAGKDGLNTPLDIASQIFTEYYFQCTEALYAKDTAAAGIPAWRYFYNATFANAQPAIYPIAGNYHASEIGIVFGTYSRENTTAQEFALSSFLQGTWAKFVKNPSGGPGWPAVGTGPEYSGAQDEDLGLLGTVGDIHGSGVTVIRQNVVDSRCPLYAQIYADALEALKV